MQHNFPVIIFAVLKVKYLLSKYFDIWKFIHFCTQYLLEIKI